MDFCLGVSGRFVALGFGSMLRGMRFSAILHLACNESLDTLIKSMAIYSQLFLLVQWPARLSGVYWLISWVCRKRSRLGVSFSDVFCIGRRLAFLSTCLIAGIFGICLGALSTYASILVLIVFIGFGVGGNIPTDATSKRATRSCIFSSPSSNHASFKSHRGIPARSKSYFCFYLTHSIITRFRTSSFYSPHSLFFNRWVLWLVVSFLTVSYPTIPAKPIS